MDEQVKAELGKELNKGIGLLFAALRFQAGLTFEQVAEAIARKRLEHIKSIESGDASPCGEDLLELISVYRVDPTEVQIEIQEIAARVRAKCEPLNPISPSTST